MAAAAGALDPPDADATAVSVALGSTCDVADGAASGGESGGVETATLELSDDATPSSESAGTPEQGEESTTCNEARSPAAPHAALATPLPSAPRSCNFGGGLCDVTVLDAIKEYLQFHGLKGTASSFQEEMEKQSLQSPLQEWNVERAPAGGELAVALALDHFDKGERDAFFNAWKSIVPKDITETPAGCALEIRARVHFGALKTRRALASASGGSTEALQDIDPEFEDLKAFLAARPTTVLDESSTSLSPLFALPFVPRPHCNPNLKFIFEESWLQKLRSDMLAFLTAHARKRHAPALRHLAGEILIARGPRVAPPPASWRELVQIADLGLAAASQASGQVMLGGFDRRQQNHPSSPSRRVRPSATPDLLKELWDAKARLAAVAARPEECQDTATDASRCPMPQMSICSGQNDAEAANGSLADARSLSSARGLRSPSVNERFWPLSREGGDGFSRASPARASPAARNLESRARAATALLPVPPALDFGRIAAVIDGSGEAAEADAGGALGDKRSAPPPLQAVLRAVLRRLALPDEPIRPRRTFLAAFACFGALRTLAERISDIVARGNMELTELALAVLAVSACEVVGRREIEAAESLQPTCMAALVKVLQHEHMTGTSILHIQCLAVLQRLSLRRNLQLKMIEFGAIDWILQELPTMLQRDPHHSGLQAGAHIGLGGGLSLFDYSVEFMSALLMNLTLRAAGRQRCGELGAYSKLVGLIEHPNPQIRTYVNGTLYALLGSPTLRAAARNEGAEATIQAALSRVAVGNELHRRQFEYMLLQLRRPADDLDGEDPDLDTPDGETGEVEDDGDNFLDEEELAGHFFLASLSAAEAKAAGEDEFAENLDPHAVEQVSMEAAAAEEALRSFRAAAPVADAQQRQFHAFIAGSCRSLMLPKRRVSDDPELAAAPTLAPTLLPDPPVQLEAPPPPRKQQTPKQRDELEDTPAVASSPRVPDTSSCNHETGFAGPGEELAKGLEHSLKAPPSLKENISGRLGTAEPEVEPPNIDSAEARSSNEHPSPTSAPRGEALDPPPPPPPPPPPRKIEEKQSSPSSPSSVRSHPAPTRGPGNPKPRATAPAGRSRQNGKHVSKVASEPPPKLPPLGKQAPSPGKGGVGSSPRPSSASRRGSSKATASKAEAATAVHLVEAAMAAGGDGRPRKRAPKPGGGVGSKDPSAAAAQKGIGASSLPQLPRIAQRPAGGASRLPAVH